jgi:magnesium transporter
MRSVLVHRDGRVEPADDVDPAWLRPDATETLWVDIENPDEADRRLLADTFRIHELAIEDAIAEIHHPKVETYGDLLYLILHRVAAAPADDDETGFVTSDVDFFLGRNFLITVHEPGSRSIRDQRDACLRHADLFADGPVGLCHQLVDRLVDQYGPEVDALETRLEHLEDAVFEPPGVRDPMRDLLHLKRDVAALRRVALPQRDAVGRLARREFPQVTEKLSYRFRDVHDHLVRVTDEAVFLQDRVTGLLDAWLSAQSNRLNQVMKVLTIIATIFMPLTVLASLYGMNVPLPQLPGGEDAQFWWILALMLASSVVMLWFFRRMRWI